LHTVSFCRTLFEIASDDRVGPNYRQAKDILTARTLVESGVMPKLKSLLVEEFPESTGTELAEDLENLLHRVMNLEMSTKLAADTVVAAPWFETNMNKYLADAGYDMDAHKELVEEEPSGEVASTAVRTSKKRKKGEDDKAAGQISLPITTKKAKVHAIGEKVNAAVALTDPSRIDALRKWKAGIAEKKEKAKILKEDRKRQAKVADAKRQEKLQEKEDKLVEQHPVVEFLTGIRGWLPPNFLVGKNMLSKKVLVDFIKSHKLHSTDWSDWLMSSEEEGDPGGYFPLHDKRASVEVLCRFMKHVIAKHGRTREWLERRENHQQDEIVGSVGIGNEEW